MSLGRAFIEVHADLRPFKKELGGGIATLLKQTQAAVDKAVKDGLDSAQRKLGGGRKGSNPVIKPDLDTTEAERDSRGFFNRFSGGFRKSVKEGFDSFLEILGSGATYNLITAGLIGALIAASPLISAALAGALTAGVGLAGIGAGVALAFQDNRIRRSAQDLGNHIMDSLFKAGAVFLEPVQRAIEILTLGIDRFLPRLERGFAKVAPYVDDLALGINQFLDAIGPGLEAAFANSGPFIQIVAEYLPVIGDALGYMFEEFSKSEGARMGLVAFFQLAADTIILFTDVVTTLANVFGGFVLWLDRLPPFLVPDEWEQDIDEMIASLYKTPEAGAVATDSLLRLGGAASDSATKARDFTASLNEFYGASLTSSDAAIRFEEAIDGVTASFRANGDVLDINSAKGRANVSAVNSSISAAIRARDAKIKETGSVSEANETYLTHIARLKGTLRQANLTEGQIEDLIGAYDDIPPEVNTNLTVKGLATALTQAQALARELSSIRSQNVRLRQAGRGDGPGGMAEGGIVTREQLTWIGEGNKPEAVIPLTNPGRAAEVMAEAGLLGMGGGNMTVQLILDGRVIDERVVKVNQRTARQIQQQPRALI